MVSSLQRLIIILVLLQANFNCYLHALSVVPTSRVTRGSNRLFLDSAVEEEWTSLLPIGIFHGITTNPVLLERAGHDCTIESVQSLARKALSMAGCSEFMCQAWGMNSNAMYETGMALSEPDRDRIVIKVPVTLEGTKAASRLIGSGVRVCLTACYSSNQAIVAAGVGAEYIAPYLGRMMDNGKDGIDECQKMQQIVDGMGSKTRILVASIRTVKSMADLASSSGLDTFTFSPDVARELFGETLTSLAAEEFESAVYRCQPTPEEEEEKDGEGEQEDDETEDDAQDDNEEDGEGTNGDTNSDADEVETKE